LEPETSTGFNGGVLSQAYLDNPISTEFKVGDRVTTNKNCGSVHDDGTEYVVFKSSSGGLAISETGDDSDVCTCMEDWVLMRGKGRPKKEAIAEAESLSDNKQPTLGL